MLSVPARIDEIHAPIEPPRVTVVTHAAAAHVPGLLAELRRERLTVEVADETVVDAPPLAPVYVIGFDTGTCAELAPGFVTWAAGGELTPGLIGLVEDGRGADCEDLLAAGFDDALVTPFSSRELVARVRAVNRRVHWKGATNGRVRFGRLTVDLHGRELWIAGKTITLTSIELAVLRELTKARGKPLSRAELLDRAWGEGDLDVSERAVDNVILRLRRKLPDPELIETVRGVGFRLRAT